MTPPLATPLAITLLSIRPIYICKVVVRSFRVYGRDKLTQHITIGRAFKRSLFRFSLKVIIMNINGAYYEY